MKPIVYENLKSLSYGELLSAISNIKEKMAQQTYINDEADDTYYAALIRELESRSPAY
jgi:hypothetical protein